MGRAAICGRKEQIQTVAVLQITHKDGISGYAGGFRNFANYKILIIHAEYAFINIAVIQGAFPRPIRPFLH